MYEVQLIVENGIIVLPQPLPLTQVRPAEEFAVTRRLVCAAEFVVWTRIVTLPAVEDDPALGTPVTAVGLGLTLAFWTSNVTVLMSLAMAEPTRMVIERGEPVGNSVIKA